MSENEPTKRAEALLRSMRKALGNIRLVLVGDANTPPGCAVRVEGVEAAEAVLDQLASDLLLRSESEGAHAQGVAAAMRAFEGAYGYALRSDPTNPFEGLPEEAAFALGYRYAAAAIVKVRLSSLLSLSGWTTPRGMWPPIWDRVRYYVGGEIPDDIAVGVCAESSTQVRWAAYPPEEDSAIGFGTLPIEPGEDRENAISRAQVVADAWVNTNMVSGPTALVSSDDASFGAYRRHASQCSKCTWVLTVHDIRPDPSLHCDTGCSLALPLLRPTAAAR